MNRLSRWALSVVVLGVAATSFAQNQPPPEKPEPGDRALSNPKPAAVAPDKRDANQPPRVRTYSTVKLVDDPAQVPRLPTQRTPPETRPTPPPERPLDRAELRLHPGVGERKEAGNDRAKPETRLDTEKLRDLRRELRETARQVRKEETTPDKTAPPARPGLDLRREVRRELRRELRPRQRSETP